MDVAKYYMAAQKNPGYQEYLNYFDAQGVPPDSPDIREFWEWLQAHRIKIHIGGTMTQANIEITVTPEAKQYLADLTALVEKMGGIKPFVVSWSEPAVRGIAISGAYEIIDCPNCNTTVTRIERWIPADEMLPDFDIKKLYNGRLYSSVYVMGFDGKEIISPVWYCYDQTRVNEGGKWYHDGEKCNVAYWRPLPEPPQEV